MAHFLKIWNEQREREREMGSGNFHTESVVADWVCLPADISICVFPILQVTVGMTAMSE